MVSEVLICSQTFSFYSQCSQVVLPKKHLLVFAVFLRKDLCEALCLDVLFDVAVLLLGVDGPITLSAHGNVVILHYLDLDTRLVPWKPTSTSLLIIFQTRGGGGALAQEDIST